jgi:long-chain acyl-CoA synthetase
VAAAVVTRAGATLDPGALRAFLENRLAHFEIPSRWWMRDEPLPTNDAGKIDKRQLRATWPVIRSTSTEGNPNE